MTCCQGDIYEALVKNCAGDTIPLPSGGGIRVGDMILGAQILSVSVSTTLTGNTICLVDASSGGITITLPSGTGHNIVVKKIDSSANVVTLSGTVDGGSKTLTSQYDSIQVISDGSEWYII